MIDLLLFGLIWGVSISFIAVALGTTWRVVGMLDFGLAGVYAVVAYTLLYVYERLQWPIWAAIAVALVAGPLLQGAIYQLLYRRFLESQKPLAVLVLLGLAVLYVCENVIALGFGSAGQLVLTERTPRLQFAGIDLTLIDAISIASLCGVVVVLQVLFHFTGVGLALRGSASNAVLASVFGVQLSRVRLAIFSMSGFLIAVPAVLTSLYEPITPSGGFTPLLFGFAALVVASVRTGMGVFAHALAGVGLGLLTGLSLLVVPSQWQLAIPFGVMLLVTAVRKNRPVQRSV
ncbi:MAG: branched-chain amino acid ABC transporter permease [Rhodospirillales bacterium]